MVLVSRPHLVPHLAATANCLAARVGSSSVLTILVVFGVSTLFV